MQRVVRRRTTTVRITLVEQTLTETIEESPPTPPTVIATALDPAAPPGLTRKRSARPRKTTVKAQADTHSQP